MKITKLLILITLIVFSTNVNAGGGDAPNVTWDEAPDPTIAGPAPTVSFTASPTTLSYGSSATLSWSTSDALTCSGTGFTASGGTSGSKEVTPGATTSYSITCIGSGGTGVSGSETTESVEVEVETVDVIARTPELSSGSLNDIGSSMTFKADVDNDGNGDLLQVITTSFEIDIGNDGTYDVTLSSQSVAGLEAESGSEVESDSWTTIEGTHAIRMTAETSEVSEEDEDGCYTVTSVAWTEEIGTEGCSTAGGANACGLAFDPQTGTATIGYEETTYILCTTEELCFDIGVGNEQNQGCGGGGCEITCYPIGEGVGEIYFEDYDISVDSITELDTSNNISSEYVFTISSPEECEDGVDNDGDGDIDYPDDVACSSGSDSDEGSPTQCVDGIDNDGNGTIDLADGACSSSGDNDESDNPECSDGIDNDGDSIIDLLDRGCDNIWDTSESGESVLDPSVDIYTIPALSLVRKGDSITVEWTAEDITTCTVSGPSISESYSSTPVSGNQVITPTEESTYTITCDSEGVESVDSVTVGIAPAFDEI